MGILTGASSTQKWECRAVIYGNGHRNPLMLAGLSTKYNEDAL